MVTTKHYCGICKRGYSRAREAKKCEAQGIIGRDIEPGLTLLRQDTTKKGLYENLFIILGREKIYAKRDEFAHHKIYRVGLVSFSLGLGEYDYRDRWTWMDEKSQEIESKLKNKALRNITSKELSDILAHLDDWRIKTAKVLKEPIHEIEPYKAFIEPGVINTINEYKLTLNNRNPFK